MSGFREVWDTAVSREEACTEPCRHQRDPPAGSLALPPHREQPRGPCGITRLCVKSNL